MTLVTAWIRKTEDSQELMFAADKHNNQGKIGGMPQLLKVYPYMQSTSFQIQDSSDEALGIFFEGRRVLHFEKISNPIFDLQKVLQQPFKLVDLTTP